MKQTSGLRPIHIMTKGAGATCNMRCDYCYYLEKGGGDKQPTAPTIMTDELLELFVKDYILSQPLGTPITFTWHGGEALLRPQAFYQKALDLQRKYGAGREIVNTLQTNGILMSQAWAKFLRDNNFLVGLSLDGNEAQHDRYRRTLGGRGSFASVMRAVGIMQSAGTEFNILSTINSYNATEPLEYYHFLKGNGIQYIQFTPIVERVRQEQARYTHVEAPRLSERPEERELNASPDTMLAPYSITPSLWGNFLCTLFDEWVREDVGKVFIQLFDATLAGWLGIPPGVCTMAKQCGHAGIIEYNGDVYGCDHYVYPKYKLGNIHTESLATMMNKPEQLRFGELKETALTEQCRTCIYLMACHGECPKNRFALSRTGEPGHNYLCKGYYQFFDHVAPYMDYMKQLLLAGRSADEVMAWHP